MQPSSLATFEVAVVVPVYNAALYLRRCLDSIVRQQDVRMRLFIINDGSSDESRDIVDEYATVYSDKVLAFHTANRGTGPSRNLALSHILNSLTEEAAENTYVFFVDADDWLEQGALSTLVAEANTSGNDIVFCDHTVHRGNVSTLMQGFWGDKRRIGAELEELEVGKTSLVAFRTFPMTTKSETRPDRLVYLSCVLVRTPGHPN